MNPGRRLSRFISRRPIEITAREPVALDSTKPAAVQLPGSVVRCILTFLHQMRPEAIRAVALSSSFLYEHARYVQHRHVHIDLNKSRHALDRLSLIKRLGQPAAIHTLQVTGRKHHQDQNEYKKTIAYLTAILPDMTGLRNLHWNVNWEGPDTWHRNTSVPIPGPILAALPTGSRLHTSVSCNEATESHIQARELLHDLINNHNLHTLSIKITFIEEHNCVETMRVLKKVLLSCPNLSSLPDIDAWYVRGGCIGYGPDGIRGSPYCGFGLSQDEKLPALEELGISEYAFGREGSLECLGYSCKGYEWDHWAENFDWSRLVRLNRVPSFLAAAMAPKLTTLRELVLGDHLYWEELEYLQYINSPLELIRVGSWKLFEDKPGLIGRFGATLQELKIHEHETNAKLTFVTTPGLIHLGNTLHCLEYLTLDLNREGQEWPYEKLDAIAAFSQVHTIDLWFPLGSEPPAATPLLTVSSARHLFSYLHERNKKILRVTFHSGSPKPTNPSCLSFGIEPTAHLRPKWDLHNAASFVCTMVYDGKTAGEDGQIGVSCPQLSMDTDAKLHRLAKQVDREPLDLGKLNKEGLLLKVALDGPLDQGQWLGWANGYQAQGKNKTLQRLVTEPLRRAWKK